MTLRRVLAALALIALVASPSQAQITPPNTLVAGNTIRAAELNTNFQTLGDKALNRITGGAIEGNITVVNDVTIDGVDLSDFLLTTGEVRAQTAGTNTAPSFSRTGETNTGMYFPAVGALGWTLSGTQRMLLDGNGLTVYGVNIISASGRIPGISSTYFTSLDGSALTNLNASNIASGTLPDARLSSNVVLEDIANVFTFAGTQTFKPGSAPAANTKLLDVQQTGAGTTVFSVDYEGDVTGASLTTTGLITTPTLKVTGGTPAVGRVLTSDATGNATWQDAGVASGTVPSGAILLFDAACPVGYTRFTALDDKFPRGGATYSATGGGSDSHTHSVDPAAVASTSNGDHTHTTDPLAVTSASGGSHSHGVSGTTDLAGINHTHTFNTSTDGSHTHSLSTSEVGAGDGGAIVVTDLTSNTTGSAGSHSHSGTTAGMVESASHGHTFSATTGADLGHTHSVDVGATTSTSNGAHTHNVDVAATTSGAASNVPAYVTMVFCKKD